MGLKPSAPKAPDPTKTAQAQAKYSTEAAHQNVNMNSLDHSGPLSSATFQHDANGNVTGQTASLDPSLQAGNVAANFGSQTGLLPQGPINWDNNTAGNIYNSSLAAYNAGVAPGRAQAQNSLDTTLSDRGIPIGSQIYNDAQGNLDRANNLQDLQASAAAYNAIPGMQNQLNANAMQQYNQPYQAASNGLGLLTSLNGLAPYAPQGQGQVAAPNYGQMVQNQYEAKQQQYQNQMNGIGDMIKAGIAVAGAPFTGGMSLGLLGGLGGSAGSNLYNSMSMPGQPGAGFGVMP